MPKPTLNLILQTIHLVFFGKAVLKPEACLKNWMFLVARTCARTFRRGAASGTGDVGGPPRNQMCACCLLVEDAASDAATEN